MSWRRREFLLSAWAGMAGADKAWAHRGHQTLSLVDIGLQGEVRITHTLTAHDTEPELVQLAPAAQPTVDDPDALQALLVHLSAAFRVNGERPEFVSHALGPDTLTFVYRAKVAIGAKSVPLKVTIGYGLFPGSYMAPVGVVQVRYRGGTKSLQFVRGSAPQSVSF